VNKSLSNDIGKPLLRLIGIGAVAPIVVYGFYIYNFGPGQWFKPSPDPADWGVFGDFVGGLLNPLFSFLAFMGVIFTVALQARQLDIVREQANFEEIQRVLATLSSRIDSFLASKPIILTDLYGAEPQKTMLELLGALGTRCLNKKYNVVSGTEESVLEEKNFQIFQQKISGELSLIGLELEALAWTLIRYSEAGGSELVIDFYKYRHQAVLIWLDVLGLLESHSRIQTFFKPKEGHVYMTPDSFNGADA
jgi:hypothetical protein